MAYQQTQTVIASDQQERGNPYFIRNISGLLRQTFSLPRNDNQTSSPLPKNNKPTRFGNLPYKINDLRLTAPTPAKNDEQKEEHQFFFYKTGGYVVPKSRCIDASISRKKGGIMG